MIIPWGLLLRVGLLLALMTAAYAGVRLYNKAIADAATAKANVATATQAAVEAAASRDKLQGMLNKADQLAKEAQAIAAKERARANKLQQDITALAAADPAVDAWLKTRVPEPVRQLRRASIAPAPTGGSVFRPNGTPRPDAGAGSPGHNERGLAPGNRRGERLAERPLIVQP